MTAREKINMLAEYTNRNKVKYLKQSITLFGAKSIMEMAKQITPDIDHVNEAVYVLAKHDALEQMKKES